ncbi:Smr/MutS family protein [Mesorhizobium sp. Z1-4]|uniref:Smr/MutS family protein n=1 Tax=Mesorhizobium sp. Z1-4 TaxID=2448478 RepID=UPI000FDB37C1|nr:Smr/MutS family protein [Mesorhizobium sp. Z1-4]
MTRKRKTLTAEDRILWGRVARTVTPLDRSDSLPEEAEEVSEPAASPPARPKRAALPAPELQKPRRPAAPPSAIDTRTHGRIAKGRIQIDGRIDLHGLTQAAAHSLLLSFLHRAHAQGLRHVLVITGKGSSPSSEGILRRAVPAWFATAPFRGLVSGHSSASRRHGGEGAFYVKLRRKPGEGV